MVLLAHDAQQGAEDGSTEHHLLGKRRQDADSHIAPRLLHERCEYLLGILVHLDAYLLIDELQGNDGSQRRTMPPREACPKAWKADNCG